MKMTLFVLSLFVFMTTAAFAQYGGAGGYISAQPQIYEPPDHPQHAGFVALGTGSSIYPGTSYTSAQGDRPASDFPQVASPSLGDIARELKKEHASVKKAPIVWINQ
jgi:hypothetical protein